MKCKLKEEVSLGDIIYQKSPSGKNYHISKRYFTEILDEDVEYMKEKAVDWETTKEVIEKKTQKVKEIVKEAIKPKKAKKWLAMDAVVKESD